MKVKTEEKTRLRIHGMLKMQQTSGCIRFGLTGDKPLGQAKVVELSLVSSVKLWKNNGEGVGCTGPPRGWASGWSNWVGR